MNEDFGCPTIVQRQVCGQASEVREMTGSHSPFLAQPKALAEMLADLHGVSSGGGVRRVG
jgi:hypothetical protein